MGDVTMRSTGNEYMCSCINISRYELNKNKQSDQNVFTFVMKRALNEQKVEKDILFNKKPTIIMEKDTRQERVIPVSHHEHEPQQNHQQNQNPQRMGNQSLFDSTFNDPFFNRASTFAENRSSPFGDRFPSTLPNPSDFFSNNDSSSLFNRHNRHPMMSRKMPSFEEMSQNMSRPPSSSSRNSSRPSSRPSSTPGNAPNTETIRIPIQVQHTAAGAGGGKPPHVRTHSQSSPRTTQEFEFPVERRTPTNVSNTTLTGSATPIKVVYKPTTAAAAADVQSEPMDVVATEDKTEDDKTKEDKTKENTVSDEAIPLNYEPIIAPPPYTELFPSTTSSKEENPSNSTSDVKPHQNGDNKSSEATQTNSKPEPAPSEPVTSAEPASEQQKKPAEFVPDPADDHRIQKDKKVIFEALAGIDEMEAAIKRWEGTSHKEKQYLIWEETLTKKLLKLDAVDGGGAPGAGDVKRMRKEAVKRIYKTLDVLESK